MILINKKNRKSGGGVRSNKPFYGIFTPFFTAKSGKNA